METTLPLDQIRTDAGTQTRAATNEETVAEYADRMLAGDEFPPVVVFHDGAEYVLADGFHRVLAAIRIGWESIETTVRAGTKLDALEYALGANRTNGLKRSNADKRRCVEIVIESFKAWSDRRIADTCGVSNTFVSGFRNQVSTVDTCQTPAKREGADGKQYTVKPKAPKVETPEPEPVPAYVAPENPEHVTPSATIVAKPSKPTAYPVAQSLDDLQGIVDNALADYTLEDLRKVDTQLDIMKRRIASRIAALKTQALNP